MALIGSHSVLSKHPGRDIGGGAIGLGCNRADFRKVSRMRAQFTASGWEPKSGTPDGVRPPYAWVLPQTDGGLASRYILSGTGTLAGSGALGRNILADIAGSGALSATGALIVSAVATLVGSGTVSAATLLAVLQAAASLTGSGELAADVDALGWILGTASGSGSLSAPPYATGELAADITPFTTLSPQSLAAAVWSALAVDSDDPGTMGEKVNAAGSAADPWTTALPGSYAPGTAGDIIGNLAATLLDETDGVETAITMREALRLILAASAGKVSGADGLTVVIRNVGDTKDRITATVDESGNRTAVTTDVS